MKYMVISDIHGSSLYLKRAIEIFQIEEYDKLIILGDFLYHGPRNNMPLYYDPKKCIEMLTSINDRLIKIRGNCDCECDEDQLLNNFYDHYELDVNGKKYFFSHGHKINDKTNNDNINANYIVFGHFHVQKNIKVGDKFYLSPGSISIPKENSSHGYMIINEDGSYEIKELAVNKTIERTLKWIKNH